jgi:hypothetical protein
VLAEEGDKLAIIVSRPKVWTRRSTGGKMITSLDAPSYVWQDTAVGTRIVKRLFDYIVNIFHLQN